jgi:hypothetical protein
MQPQIVRGGGFCTRLNEQDDIDQDIEYHSVNIQDISFSILNLKGKLRHRLMIFNSCYCAAKRSCEPTRTNVTKADTAHYLSKNTSDL